MFKLARLNHRDTFLDLGSGWGQNVLIAMKEFKVRKAVGIEADRIRHQKSMERLKELERGFPSLRGRGKFIRGYFDSYFSVKWKNFVSDINIEQATVVFYGLESSSRLARGFQEKLRHGCRLLYYFNALFPEFMPDRKDFPFYVSINNPFLAPSSERQWLSFILSNSSAGISKEELWDEFAHDYQVEIGSRKQLDQYKTRLERAIRSHY